MEIARNIWLFITCLLLVTSCIPGKEIAGDELDENDTETKLHCVLNVLVKFLNPLQEAMPWCGKTHWEDKLWQNYGSDPPQEILEAGFKLAPECLTDENNKKENKCDGCDTMENCKPATTEIDSNENKCDDCDTMEICKPATTESDSNVSAFRKDTVSAGTSILFFLLGLVVGLVILTLVCICCPAAHTKSTTLLNAARGLKETKGDKSISKMSLNKARDEEVVPSSVAVEMTGTRENRQSNMYNEPYLYSELTCEGEGRSYDTARNQPVLERAESSGYNHLHSGPVNISQGHTYQPFIPEGNRNENYSAIQLDGQRAPAVQSKFDTSDQDTMPAEEAHDYFVLEATSDKALDTTPVPGPDTNSPETEDHEYFVLEANSDKALDTTPVPGPDNNNPETVGHDYFVLEAQTN